MNPNRYDKQSTEKKLSEQLVEFIDLTDQDLEEVEVLELGKAQGGNCGCGCGWHRGCGCGWHRGCGCGWHRGCGCGWHRGCGCGWHHGCWR